MPGTFIEGGLWHLFSLLKTTNFQLAQSLWGLIFEH